MAHTDVELIQRILQRDQDALSPLVKKYQKGVHTLAWRKIGDFHVAQEITQDTFLAAYQKLRTLKNHNLFAGWLYVIAANLCRDWLKKSRLPMDSLDITDANEVDKVSYSRYVAEKQKADADETRREVVKKLLQKLPESERTVMMLHYLGEMTINAISEFLGVSQNTVKSRLSRARNRLKKEEDIIQESLGSFQLPDSLAENIMQEVSRMAPVPPPAVSKPVAPLALSVASAVLLFLLMGVGTQYLSRFQKPYNFSATSEPTVEIIDAVFVLDSPAKPAVRSQAGSSAIPGKSPGAGQKPDESLFATLPVDTTEVSTPKPQWNQTKGPAGAAVSSLFVASDGDLYARAGADLYRLADNGNTWRLANVNMSINGSWQMKERGDTLYIVSDTQVLASTDRGETWNSLGARPEGQLIDLVITDGDPEAQADIIMYLGLADGVFHSVDTGKSWISLSNGDLVGRKIRAITAIENTVFVGTDNGLYRRNSEGWEQLPVGEARNVRALASADHRLYVAVGIRVKNQAISSFMTMSIRIEDGPALLLYRSTDLGNSWHALNFVETAASEEIGFSMSGVSNNSEPEAGSIISGTEAGSIIKMVAAQENLWVIDSRNSYYSNDSGETWVAWDSSTSDIGVISTLASLDANTLYKSGQFGIYRTTDAGKTWHQFNTGLVRTSVLNLVSMHNVLYANTGRVLVTSSDGGESWTPVAGTSRNLTSLAKFNGAIYARGTSGMSPQFFRLSAEDNGLIPVPGMPVLGRLDFNALMGERLKNALLAAVPDEVKKNAEDSTKLNPEDLDIDTDTFSEDYREAITDIIVESLRSLFGSFAVSGDTYYMEYEQKLFRWKTGTTEWYDTGLIDEGEPVDVTDGFDNPDSIQFKLAVSGSTVYVGKWDGHLFQSFDEGNTWNDVTANLPFPVAHFRAVTFAGSTVYVATDKGVASSNDGISWQAATDAEGMPLIIEKLAVDGTTVYGTNQQRVCQLKANANTWQQVTPEIPVRVNSLAVDGNTLYVGTAGSGVLRFTLDESE